MASGACVSAAPTAEFPDRGPPPDRQPLPFTAGLLLGYSLRSSAALLVQPESQGQFPALRRGPSAHPSIFCSSTLEGVDRPGEETMKIGAGMQPAIPRTYANMEWKAQEPTAKAVPRREL